MRKIFKFLFNDNPILIFTLGLCSVLAITTTFEKSYIMGIIILIALILCNIITSIIKKFIKEEIRIPVYIIIIATIITIIQIFISRYSPNLYKAFGIYLPLLTVNCVLLGSCLSYASSHSLKDSFINALKNGLGYLVVISIIGFLRELLGSGKITIMNDISLLTGYRFIIDVFNNDILPNKIFLTSGGAFILLGLVMGIIRKLNRGDN